MSIHCVSSINAGIGDEVTKNLVICFDTFGNVVKRMMSLFTSIIVLVKNVVFVKKSKL